MFKKLLLITTVVIVTALSFNLAQPALAAIETPLVVDASASTDNAPYQQTQWYGFTATGGKGYCVILAPSTGNSDLYLFDNAFNLKTSSKKTDLTADKVWYGQSATGPFHIASFGVANHSTNYTIQAITAPYVSSISPTTGNPGTLITINGYGFGATRDTSYVKFGTVQATDYSAWSNTQIKVYMPAGVTTGTIQIAVYVATKTSNATNFTATSGTSSNGTMDRYDLGRTGSYPNGPTALPLNLKWTFNVATWGEIKGAPVGANGIIYFGAVAIENQWDYSLFAVDANTGTLKWKYSTGQSLPDQIQSTPAIANGKVYVGVQNGKFYALDANTGSLKWSYAAQGYILTSSPVVYNGIVYFGTYIGWTEGIFYALDANTGSLKWSYRVLGGIYSPPAIANGIVYFHAIGDGLYALNANTGALKWKANTPIYGYANIPAIANNIVYALSSSGPLYALDANTGALKWQYGGNASNNNSAAVSNGLVYFGPRDKLRCHDANTGAVKWESTIIENIQSPIISNNTVYVHGKRLYALDSNTGVIKWSYDPGDIGNLETPSTSPTIHNGKVYVSWDKTLYCFGQ